MRALAPLLGLALLGLATPVVADPLPLPSLGVRRVGNPHPFVIGPTNITRRHAPVANIDALRRRVAIARGLERVEILDELTARLEDSEPPDDEIDRLFDEIVALYQLLLHEPALEKSIHADELLVRGAKNVMGRDEPLSRQAAERVLAKYPRSPFIADARIVLSELAERRRAFGEAATHLRAVVALGEKPFSTYARLRLGWTLSLAGDHKGAIAELAGLVVDGGESHIVETALDLLVVPYAKAGRADLAAALFDRGDRSETPDRLRRLASEYSDRGKLAEANTVLRAAIVRDGDLTAICLDRADLVYITSQGKNRIDLALAIAQLEEARKAADASCTLAADMALARAKGPAR